MADLSHNSNATPLAGAPFTDLDAPVGFPATGFQPPNAGLQAWNVTAATAQVVQLPNPHSTRTKFVRVEIVTLTAETYAVLASYDGGVTYPEAPVMINLTTGALATPATLGVGSYLIPASVDYTTLKFTKSGAVNPGVGAVSWASVPKA